MDSQKWKRLVTGLDDEAPYNRYPAGEPDIRISRFSGAFEQGFSEANSIRFYRVDRFLGVKVAQ